MDKAPVEFICPPYESSTAVEIKREYGPDTQFPKRRLATWALRRRASPRKPCHMLTMRVLKGGSYARHDGNAAGDRPDVTRSSSRSGEHRHHGDQTSAGEGRRGGGRRKQDDR